MAGVAGADHNSFLAFARGVGAFELGGVAQDVALEVGEAFSGGWEVLLARMASGLDDVLWVEGACLCGAVGEGALEGDRPQLRCVVPGGRFEGRLDPDVELKELGVGLEEFAELVLRREDRPVRGEVDVWHVVVPDGVVEHKLVVSPAPVVADSVLAVDE